MPTSTDNLPPPSQAHIPPPLADRSPAFALRRAVLFVALYSIAHFLFLRWNSPFHPRWRAGVDTGWYGWFDQQSYATLAAELIHGQISTVQHGPGMALFIAPFTVLMPNDPFLLPMLLLYVGTMLLTLRLLHWFVPLEISVLAIILLSHSTHFAGFFANTWNNTVVAFACMSLLILSDVGPRWRLAGAVAVGVLMSWVLATRYGDVLLLIPLALLVLYNLAPTWRERFTLAVVAGVASLPLVIFTGYVHQVAFGSPFITPYHHVPSPAFGNSVAGLESRSWDFLGYHLFSMFINPHVFYQNAIYEPDVPSFAAALFILIFVGLGLLTMAQARPALTGAAGASFLLALGYYGTYEFTGQEHIKYNAMRFFLPWIPFLITAGVVGVITLVQSDLRDARERWRIAGGLAIPLVFVGGLYGYAQLAKPTPDPQQVLERFRWQMTIRAADSAAYHFTATPLYNPLLRDGLVYTGVSLPPNLPSGTRLLIDMAQVNTIERVTFVHDLTQPFPPFDLDVTVSTDGNCWLPVTNQHYRSDQQRLQEIAFAPVSTRFLQIVIRNPIPPNGAAIGEVYIYGKRPPITNIRLTYGSGWYPCEKQAAQPLYWMLAPATLHLEAKQPQAAMLSFRVAASVQPTTTLTLHLNGTAIAAPVITAEREIQVGPVWLPAGDSVLTFTIAEPPLPASVLGDPRDERMLHLLIEDMRVVAAATP